jgi:hypothetical protein
MRGVLVDMTERLAREVAEIGVRLLDDAYMAWFAAESECERALQAWSEETRHNRADAYWAYSAALDREEAAARDLQRLEELALPCRERLATSDSRGAADANSTTEVT